MPAGIVPARPRPATTCGHDDTTTRCEPARHTVSDERQQEKNGVYLELMLGERSGADVAGDL
jgi:hypothetical protein